MSNNQMNKINHNKSDCNTNINLIIAQLEKKDKLSKEKAYQEVANKVMEMMYGNKTNVLNKVNKQQTNLFIKIVYFFIGFVILSSIAYFMTYVISTETITIMFDSMNLFIYKYGHMIKYYLFYLRYLVIKMFISVMASIGVTIDIVNNNFTW